MTGLVPLSLIVKPSAACPHYVPLGTARVKVVWTALIESCDTATKTRRKPVIVVLVLVQVPVLDASKWLRSPAAPAWTVTDSRPYSESES